MARRVRVDQFAAAVQEILTQYGTDIHENLDDIVTDITKQGVKTLKGEARGTFRRHTGKYAAGWTSEIEIGRFSSQGTIYNAKVPGLPHLLEHGHANRNGGRTPGRVHIAPVEAEMVRTFEEQVKSKL